MPALSEPWLNSPQLQQYWMLQIGSRSCSLCFLLYYFIDCLPACNARYSLNYRSGAWSENGMVPYRCTYYEARLRTYRLVFQAEEDEGRSCRVMSRWRNMGFRRTKKTRGTRLSLMTDIHFSFPSAGVGDFCSVRGSREQPYTWYGSPLPCSSRCHYIMTSSFQWSILINCRSAAFTRSPPGP